MLCCVEFRYSMHQDFLLVEPTQDSTAVGRCRYSLHGHGCWVTHRLGACLLLVVQAAQRQLQQQLEAAEQLQQDVEQLKTENLETWQQKYELEGQLATARANMEGMQGQASSMQKVSALTHVLS